MCQVIFVNFDGVRPGRIIDVEGELIETIQHKEISPETVEANKKILDMINAQAEWEDTEWLPDDFER